MELVPLIQGAAPNEVLRLPSRRLKASREELFDALQGDLTDSHHFVLDELMHHIEELEARITRFDAGLLEGLRDEHNTLVLLQTLPGIDLIGVALLLVEIGNDMSALGHADRLASWVGICPGNHESAGKRKSGRTRKGNPYVRRLLCEFAHAASRTRCALQSKYQALVVRRGRKRAIIALAHRMLRTIFFMLSRGQHYRDSAIDYEALVVRRNAPRWINALTRFGFLPYGRAAFVCRWPGCTGMGRTCRPPPPNGGIATSGGPDGHSLEPARDPRPRLPHREGAHDPRLLPAVLERPDPRVQPALESGAGHGPR
jgi:hypothetical protein